MRLSCSTVQRPHLATKLGTLAFLLVATQVLAFQYTIETLGPSEIQPLSVTLNDSGTVLLTVREPGGDINLLRITDSGSTGLKSLFPRGAAQNNRDVLVGLVDLPNGDQTLRRWENGVVTDLFPISNEVESVVALNDAEQYIGLRLGGPGASSFLGSSASPIVDDLGNLGEPVTVAQAINGAGDIVGVSKTGATRTEVNAGKPIEEAFIYSNGSIEGIGVFNGISSFARGINAFGEIVGETSSTPAGIARAFYYEPTNGMSLLALSGRTSSASDINDSGVIVGFQVDDLGTFVAFAGSSQGVTPLLDQIPPDSGWERLSQAMSNNNSGEIVGLGFFEGEVRAFLATPIPEPSTIVIGLYALLLMPRRRLRARRRRTVS